MSRRMINTLGFLLAICFLMSVTVAAVSADAVNNTKASQKNAKGLMQGMQGKNVYIRNLIIASNVAIFTGRSTNPFLRAAVLKRMVNTRNNTGTTDNTTAYNMNDNTTAEDIIADNATADDIIADNTTADDIIADNTTADNTTDNNLIANNTADVIAKNVKVLSQGKIVFVRNLIVARNVVIFSGRSTNPILRAAVNKKMMNNTGMMNNTEMMNNTGTLDNKT
jgi:disulfide oxidoreductase YuzD